MLSWKHHVLDWGSWVRRQPDPAPRIHLCKVSARLLLHRSCVVLPCLMLIQPCVAPLAKSYRIMTLR